MNGFTYFAAAAALMVNYDALALGSVATVTVIDRDSGAALPMHYFRGEYWVAGQPGARYAVEIRNCAGGRVLAVTSVDGINVVSGANAAWNQTGYVFDPAERYLITGWRKSSTEVAAFTFAESPNSYAERTGRPANVGVIGVAIFREREPDPVSPQKVAPSADVPSDPRAQESPRSAASPPPAMSSRNALAGMGADSRQTSPFMQPIAPLPAPKLGTGHGVREYSYVTNTEFRRMQSEPNELIRIRYDSMDNLVAMGVVRRPRPMLPIPNAFPDSQERQFVPDPPG